MLRSCPERIRFGPWWARDGPPVATVGKSAYPWRVTLYHLGDPVELVEPTVVAAFDGWIDAGSAATTAADLISTGGPLVATFDGDTLYDYRARRPTLQIVDGRLAELTWPALTLRRARIAERDLLVLSGAEPDFHWQELAEAIVELMGRLGVVEFISLGAIPAAVPHTRDVPIMGTASESGVLHADVKRGPMGVMRVPSAALSVIDMSLATAGVPTVGYFGQIPHYVSGPYPAASLELLRVLGAHLGVELPQGLLPAEARQVRTRLNAAVQADETTREYVERLESMVDESRLPSGDDLISDIERFLRERGSTEGGLLN